MRKLSGNIVGCTNCDCTMEYDESDIVSAVVCPDCNALVRVKKSSSTIKTITDLSWKEIQTIIRTEGAKALPLGATKEITLKDGKTYLVQVADRKGKAIFCFKDLYGDNDNGGRSMNDNYTTEGGYAKSEMHKWLNSDFVKLLPDDLLAVIVPSAIKVGNKSINATVFLPSEYEIYGKKVYGKCEEGEQFELFTDWHNRIAGYPDGDYGRYWWGRTVASSSYFCYVNDNGNVYYHYAIYSGGVRPFFSIS